MSSLTLHVTTVANKNPPIKLHIGMNIKISFKMHEKII